jgi:hypothetical protein
MSKHEPAFPGVELNGNGSPYQSFFGMTKREFFALEIMKGVLSNPTTEVNLPNECCDYVIALADKLIDKLEKPT